MILRPYQSEAIEATLQWFSDGKEKPLIVLPTGCHAAGTKIIMFDGSLKNVEDVRVGDKIMGDDGTPRTVLNLARGNEAMYKITPNSGGPFVVNENHILALRATNEGKKWESSYNGSEYDFITVKEYLSKTKYYKHIMKLYRAKYIELSKKVLPVDPYFLGLCLGDGHLKNTLTITSADAEIINYCCDYANKHGCYTYINKKENNKAVSVAIAHKKANRYGIKNPIVQSLKDCGVWGYLSDTKFIPSLYKQSSVSDRLELLAGLIDTDGSLSQGVTFDYISKSKVLAEDVQYVARSVGLCANLRPCQKSCQTGAGGTYYRVTITGDVDIVPVKIKRKIANKRRQKKSPFKTGFKVEPVGDGSFYGFELDGNHLYLTSDFIVHHNTGKSLCQASLAQTILNEHPHVRIILSTHSKELVEQNHDEIKEIWPECPAGIYSAGLNRRDAKAQVLFAGIQSIYNKSNKIGHVDLIIVDECFVSGTKILTPSGEKDIDSMRCGDVVINSTGVGMVEAISAKNSYEIYKLEFDDGKIIECTGNHPIFTEYGWIEARKLENGTHTFSPEGLRALWQNVQTLDQTQRKRENSFSMSRADLEKPALLLSILCEEIEKSNEQSSIKVEDETTVTRNKAQTYKAWRERAIATFAAVGIASRSWGGVGVGVSGSNEYAEKFRFPDLLQNRYSKQGKKNRNRAGRKFTRNFGKTKSGFEKNRTSCFPRLVNISRYEYESPRTVFNLQISGHPSYFANGKLVHNCHTISRKTDTMWGQFFSDMKAINPNVQIMGLTATDYRLDSGNLVPHTFDGVAYEYSVLDAIKDGYLCELVSAPVETHLKTDGVKKRGGEYIAGELERAFDKDDLTAACVNEIIKYGQDRKSWMVFAAGNTHARHITEMLIDRGIDARCVTQETPIAERDQAVKDHKSGALKCLVNNLIFTTGYNNKMLDLIACLRATQSQGLWVQICGRGMRLHEGKENCLLLDFAHNIDRHGPIDRIKGKAKDLSSGEGEAPLKQCPKCFEPVYAATRICPNCGHEFPEGGLNIDTKASTGAILSTQIVPQIYDVFSVTYKRNQGRDGKPDSMMVTYNTFSGQIREWVFFGHTINSVPYRKAQQWSKARGGEWKMSLEEALTHEWPKPDQIEAIKDGKYWRVTNVFFNEKTV